MPLLRRTLLAAAPALALPGLARAAADDPTESPRTLGQADAPVSVVEFYSLTCTHCAEFDRDVLPKVQKNFIATGKLFYEFYDFPLDQVALMAAMVARSLPPVRYAPFVSALLSSQDVWAFARGVNYTEALAKMAALAGMARPQFDQAIADQKLKDWILNRMNEAQQRFGIDSTPTFVFSGPKVKDRREVGAVPYVVFAQDIKEVGG
jgi:protein-disulfide isomerase